MQAMTGSDGVSRLWPFQPSFPAAAADAVLSALLKACKHDLFKIRETCSAARATVDARAAALNVRCFYGPLQAAAPRLRALCKLSASPWSADDCAALARALPALGRAVPQLAKLTLELPRGTPGAGASAVAAQLRSLPALAHADVGACCDRRGLRALVKALAALSGLETLRLGLREVQLPGEKRRDDPSFEHWGTPPPGFFDEPPTVRFAWPRLQELALQRCALALLPQLAAAALPALRALAVCDPKPHMDRRAADEAIAHVWRAPWVRQLASLRVLELELASKDALEALEAAPWFSGLQRLSITSCCGLGANAATAALALSRLTALTSLELGVVEAGAGAAAALLAPGPGHSGAGACGRPAAAAAAASGQLRELKLIGVSLGGASGGGRNGGGGDDGRPGIALLADLRLPHLTKLSLNFAELTADDVEPPGARAVGRLPRGPQDLQQLALGLRGHEALADLHLPKLARLELESLGMCLRSLNVLNDVAWLEGLQQLHVRGDLDAMRDRAPFDRLVENMSEPLGRLHAAGRVHMDFDYAEHHEYDGYSHQDESESDGGLGWWL
ncbi:MAG: hypothetical protein J3K34DRAFT_519594 [Monoraphidium minutum]|nr:MAG: hypothetical protein J3K34DRAFT_519594 [Monoraphidium minutum]